MKFIYKILLVGLFVVGSIVYTNGQEFKIVVNSSNPVSSLTKKQVSNYFLKKTTKWSNSTIVQPVDLGSRSSVRANFSKNIHKKSIGQVRAFWQQSVFSGKASPPPEMQNDNAVVYYVKTHKGAIGYVSKNANTNGVKTITIK